MNPIEALREVAFLLERDQAETYRVKAFRTAAAVISQLPPSDVDARIRRGTLTGITGIGKVTAEVVTEAAAGQVPVYLADLRQRPGPDRGLAGPLLDALQGDLHVHSDWSDGGSPIDEMAFAARDLGHSYIALTDHSARLKVARGLTRERRLQQLDVLEALNEELAPFRLLAGIEVDILDDGSLDADEDILERLDVVVASVHSKLRMAPLDMTRRMVNAVENPHVDVLGHCTGRLVVGRGRPESTFDAAVVFAACARSGTAVEINCRPERLDPPRRLLAMAVAAGCWFSIDTDAHAPGQLTWQPYGAVRAVEREVPAERVINTWNVDALLGWACR